MTEKPRILYTSRLCLQPFRPEDQAALTEILTNEEIAKTYMIPEFPCREAAARLAERFRQLSLEETRVVYGIYLEGGLIGFANEVCREGDAVEVGYVIHPAHQNRGYATEALDALIAALFSMGFDTVRAGAFEENRASMRVMEKCGMTPTGETEEIAYRGKQHRCIYYEISAPKVQPTRKPNRITAYDYSQNGGYFITICTQDRKKILSNISVGTPLPGCPQKPCVKLLWHGEVADKYIRQMDAFYEHLSVDQYIIMPDHIHLLITIHESNGHPGTGVPTRASEIARFVGTFKRFCNKEYGGNIWQSRYYDHVIRNQQDYNEIWEYIGNNPLKWVITHQQKT